jgi:hypothetical protein
VQKQRTTKTSKRQTHKKNNLPSTGRVERVLQSHNADLQRMGWDKDGRLVAVVKLR